MRRNQTSASPPVSLFPFLAVLLCTMGSLIVLLVVITRQARLEASTIATETAAEDVAAAQDAIEDLQWRLSALEESRAKTDAQLTDKRRQLASTEEHLLRLRQEWQRLVDAAKNFETSQGQSQDTSSAIQVELERLKHEILDAERALEKAREEAKNREQSYAVVPYAGPNQTMRRPLYIECTKDKIILQPEGIEFTDKDFDDNLGPGNPLAASLRAARDYLAMRESGAIEASGDPYPLLLVRPDGINAYNVSRVALSSFGADFGYEFVDPDWNLKYPAVDPELAEVERQAAEEARKRIVQRRPAASGLYARRSRPAYRASPVRGGIVRDDEGGSSFGTDESGLPQRNAIGSREGVASPDSHGENPFAKEGNGTEAKGDPDTPQGQANPRGPGGTANEKPSGTKRSDQESLAKKRGRNWSVPKENARAIPIRRPILLGCRSDQIVVLPDKGATGGKSIVLEEETEESIDELVQAVWSHTKSWGTAGNGMYWLPELVLEVHPGGEKRYEELQRLLEGSGLEIRKGR